MCFNALLPEQAINVCEFTVVNLATREEGLNVLR